MDSLLWHQYIMKINFIVLYVQMQSVEFSNIALILYLNI